MKQATRKSNPRALMAFTLAAAVAGCADVEEHEGEYADSPEEVLGTEEALLSTSLPSALAVPAGHPFAFWLTARGDQVYACKPSEGGHAWTLVGPDAELFGPFGKLRLGYHYLGPTWEALDGSYVVAAKEAGVTVDATAIPWLLLRSTGNTGRGLMSKVSFIQRIKTVGGLAPNSGCDEEHLEDRANIPYSATYVFYR
jgi:hypothetical protein